MKAKKKVVSDQRLRERFGISEAGRLIWISGRRAGSVVTGYSRSNYRTVEVDGCKYYVHRLVCFIANGVWPQFVDHIDGDRSNNILSNLRDVSHAKNCQNRRGPNSNNRAGILGAYPRSGGRWESKIRRGAEVLSLGVYATAEEAHQAFLCAKRKYHEGCTL